MNYEKKQELLRLSAKALVYFQQEDDSEYFYLNGKPFLYTSDVLELLSLNDGWYGEIELPKYEFFTLDNGEKQVIHTCYEDLRDFIKFNVDTSHLYGFNEPMLVVDNLIFENNHPHKFMWDIDKMIKIDNKLVYCELSDRLDYRIPKSYKEQLVALKTKLFDARENLANIIRSYDFGVSSITIHVGDSDLNVGSCSEGVCHAVLDLAKLEAKKEINNINDDINYFSKKR